MDTPNILLCSGNQGLLRLLRQRAPLLKFLLQMHGGAAGQPLRVPWNPLVILAPKVFVVDLYHLVVVINCADTCCVPTHVQCAERCDLLADLYKLDRPHAVLSTGPAAVSRGHNRHSK